MVEVGTRAWVLTVWSFAAFGFAAIGCDDGPKDGKPETDTSIIDEEMTCTLGAEGCTCAVGSECLTGLICSPDNVCEAVTCMVGALNCACGENDSCASSSDECVGGRCVPRSDCVGELGCGCDAGTCGAGLSCIADICRVPNGALVRVSGGDARACDFHIETSSGRHVSAAVFPAGVRGQSRVRNEKGSIALIASEDAALDGVVATIVLTGSDPAAAADINLTVSRCYDRMGRPNDSVSVTIE